MKLIKLGAEWCGPCHLMDERLQNFTLCEVVKYDVDNEYDPATAAAIEKYNVRNVPVIVLETDNGETLRKWVGAVSLEEINTAVNDALSVVSKTTFEDLSADPSLKNMKVLNS